MVYIYLCLSFTIHKTLKFGLVKRFLINTKKYRGCSKQPLFGRSDKT